MTEPAHPAALFRIAIETPATNESRRVRQAHRKTAVRITHPTECDYRFYWEPELLFEQVVEQIRFRRDVVGLAAK